MVGGSALFTGSAVIQRGYWRVKMAWPNNRTRYFGRLNSEKEARAWIAEHGWLTQQSAEQRRRPKPKKDDQ